MKKSKYYFAGNVVKREFIQIRPDTPMELVKDVKLHLKISKASSKQLKTGDILIIDYRVDMMNQFDAERFDFSKEVEVTIKSEIKDNRTFGNLFNDCEKRIRNLK